MKKTKARTGLPALLLCGLLAYALTAPGGSLEPSGPPQPTMRNLNEIYDAVGSVARGGLTYPEKLGVGEMWGDRNVYGPWVRIVGETQGEIRGECTILGREDSIECIGFDHDVYVPYDAQTFRPLGGRLHTPISIIKLRTDKSTPPLYRALCTGELLTEVEIRFWRIGGTGGQEQYFTILLDDARIVDIRYGYTNLERVSFIYGSITWRYEDGSIEYQDNVASK